MSNLAAIREFEELARAYDELADLLVNEIQAAHIPASPQLE